MNHHNSVEKRKYPRMDMKGENGCYIKVFGVKGKPVTGRVLNLSLGGVAFISHYKNIAKAVKRFTTKVEIQLPNGKSVEAITSLQRIRPTSEGDDCLCVLELIEINNKSSSRLENYITD
ncbi:PilZ domain-containing protein [candidate division KSB1 bacterium]|nr:PilZ domain-containing protein [candidate division KSB1 bacterium]NIR70185.1 PilZ domain-containing protein [candidate division KSB1 bacterium]NIS27572.1 PilZ domain-containing protein [candidate division KSB1 bacterium]NIT74424.1 PilZ domain-containing protein [candidate division KSB1 bacterium]NIU28289.1 PilZ domain-containing protein [candidate division KSB1 bacterium]